MWRAHPPLLTTPQSPSLSLSLATVTPNVRLQEIHIAQAIQASQDNPHAAPIVIPIPVPTAVPGGSPLL